MINLKSETLEILKDKGYEQSDVEWVGNDEFEIPLDKFWKLSDVDYDSGYGGEEVATDLLVVLKDGSWLERHEYDGSEWWEYKATPTRPAKVLHKAFAVTRDQAPRNGWNYTLADMNRPVLEECDD